MYGAVKQKDNWDRVGGKKKKKKIEKEKEARKQGKNKDHFKLRHIYSDDERKS